MRTLLEIKHAFNAVPPNQLTEGHKMRMLKLTKNIEDLAGDIFEYTPESADRTHALRLLLDCKFWCVQAITHETKKPPGPPVEPPTPGGKNAIG